MTFSLIALWALLIPGEAPGEHDLLLRAESSFSEGLIRREAGRPSRALFRAAASSFEELHRRGANNSLLYRNLGNARLLAGDLPGAILAYRLGLRLKPGDRILRENLSWARRRVAFREGSPLGRPPEDVRPGWLAALGPGWLFLLALSGYAGGCLALVRWLMFCRRSSLLVGLTLLASSLAGGAFLYREHQEQDSPLVVIAADGVLLRKGNGGLFPPRYETPLNRGVEGELLFRRGDWLQIELSGGEVGWVSLREARVEDR
jgi:hypothetical protein